jgi:hypothetical protein
MGCQRLHDGRGRGVLIQEQRSILSLCKTSRQFDAEAGKGARRFFLCVEERRKETEANGTFLLLHAQTSLLSERAYGQATAKPGIVKSTWV